MGKCTYRNILGEFMVSFFAMTPLSAPSPKSNGAKIDRAERTTYVTPDSVVLVGTFVPATKVRAPAVLLLHQLGRARATYEAFLQPLRDAGFASLSLDFRGHGDSTKVWDKDISWEDFSENDWQGINTDVATALAGLRKQRGVDPENIAVVGASIGANTALVTASGDPGIKSVVLLSPGLDYRGIKTEAAGAGLAQRSVMIVAAENDSYSFESSKKLAQVVEKSVFVQEKGEAHGTDMLVANPALLTQIIDFLSKSLTPSP